MHRFERDDQGRWCYHGVHEVILQDRMFNAVGDAHHVSRERDSLLLSLLNFNLGVEAGRLVAVLIVVPLLAWLRSTPLEAGVVRLVSLAMLAVGLGLFVERLAFSE